MQHICYACVTHMQHTPACVSAHGEIDGSALTNHAHLFTHMSPDVHCMCSRGHAHVCGALGAASLYFHANESRRVAKLWSLLPEAEKSLFSGHVLNRKNPEQHLVCQIWLLGVMTQHFFTSLVVLFSLISIKMLTKASETRCGSNS